METVQQNGRFTLFSSKFQSNIYSILFGFISSSHYIFAIKYVRKKVFFDEIINYEKNGISNIL